MDRDRRGEAREEPGAGRGSAQEVQAASPSPGASGVSGVAAGAAAAVGGRDNPDPVAAVGALGDELRRGMYAFIRRARRPVTRDEAAQSVGISRKLAAFHLDKLVSVGLLRTRTEAPGRSRGVGRAPKLYEPVPDAVQVSIPARRHELLAQILTDALLTEGEPGTARESAMRAAERHGEARGGADRTRQRPGRLGTERALTLAAENLEELGFEPQRVTPALVMLRNCPFHPLAVTAPELICGINHRFLCGYLRGLGAAETAAAVLDPQPDACCVRLCAPDTSPAKSDQ